QDLAHCPLGQLRQARMNGGRSVLPGMRSEQPGGPQFVGIIQLLGFPARQGRSPRYDIDKSPADVAAAPHQSAAQSPGELLPLDPPNPILRPASYPISSNMRSQTTTY